MHARHLESRLLDCLKLHLAFWMGSNQILLGDLSTSFNTMQVRESMGMQPLKDPIIIRGQQLQIIPAKDLLLLSSKDFKLLPKSKNMQSSKI